MLPEGVGERSEWIVIMKHMWPRLDVGGGSKLCRHGVDVGAMLVGPLRIDIASELSPSSDRRLVLGSGFDQSLSGLAALEQAVDPLQVESQVGLGAGASRSAFRACCTRRFWMKEITVTVTARSTHAIAAIWLTRVAEGTAASAARAPPMKLARRSFSARAWAPSNR